MLSDGKRVGKNLCRDMVTEYLYSLSELIILLEYHTDSVRYLEALFLTESLHTLDDKTCYTLVLKFWSYLDVKGNGNLTLLSYCPSSIQKEYTPLPSTWVTKEYSAAGRYLPRPCLL